MQIHGNHEKYNQRQRFINTVKFMPVDRPPLWEFGYLGTTLKRWGYEGLPGNMLLEEFFGLDAAKYFPKEYFF